MNNESAFKIIEFWKQLEVELKLEEMRYNLYLEKYKTIEASVEYERSLELSVIIQNQDSYVKTLRKKHHEIITHLDGFAKTLKDNEMYIFANTVLIYRRSLDYVAKELGISVAEVQKIRNSLLADLNEYWEYNPVEPI